MRFAVKQVLIEKLSPDTICGSAKRNGDFQETVCTKTLYNYVQQGLLKVRNIDLVLCQEKVQVKNDLAPM